MLAFLGDDFERGLSLVIEAIEHCPSCNSAWGSSTLLYGIQMRSAEAIAHGEMALKLNPRDPLAYRVYLGMMIGYIGARNYEAVLSCIDRVRPFVVKVRGFRYFEIASNLQLGRLDRARDLAARYLSMEPETTVSGIRSEHHLVRAYAPGLYDEFYPALIAAGIPE